MISDIETVVLGLICQGNQYGYDIEKEIRDRNIRLWTDIAFSSIYYVLRRLEERSYITSSIQEVEGKPSRRIYAPTDDGRTALRERLKMSLSETQKVIQPFNLGIGFMGELKPEEVLECLNRYLKCIDDNIAYAESGLQRVARDRRPYFIRALYSRPMAILKAERRWVEGFIEEILEHVREKEGSLKWMK